MKKSFAAIMAALCFAPAITAAELDLLPMYSSELCWSGASLENGKATWTEGWGGVVFNLENKDFSAYNYVVFEFAEPTHAKYKAEVYYASASDAGTATEADAASSRIVLKLDENKKNDIAKVALMSAKPGSATLSKAVMVDELEIDPVLFEGSVEVPDMKKVYFKLGAEKFIGLKKGQTLTVEFTTGNLQQYASVDFYSNNAKLACQNTRTNTKKDGQFALDATHTSTVVAEDGDVEKLQSYGLQLKGRNVTITKVTLADGAVEPDKPENPDQPVTPGDNVLWTGETSTGKWANDITVDAPKFAAFAAGDKIAIYLRVDAGSEYGSIELDDQKYTKLAADGTGDGLDSYGCIQPDVTCVTYEFGSADASLLKKNGLRVKGANITVNKIERIAGSGNPGGDTPGSTDIWSGSVSTGKWANDATVDSPKFATVKGGDIISIYLAVDGGSDYGQIELDDQQYTKLACDGKAGALDNYGCIQPDVTQLDYVITSSDATLLKSNGLRVKGSSITISRIVLTEGTGEPGPDEPQENFTETVLWSGSVNCGQWAQTITVPADKWADAVIGDKFRINLKINAGKGKGIVKVQSDGADLEVNGKGTNMDTSGNFQRGASEAVYEIVEGDLAKLKANGLVISGFAVTVSQVSLLKQITDAVDSVDVEENAPVEYYNLNGVRIETPANGLYIRRQGNKVSKVYLR